MLEYGTVEMLEPAVFLLIDHIIPIPNTGTSTVKPVRNCIKLLLVTVLSALKDIWTSAPQPLWQPLPRLNMKTGVHTDVACMHFRVIAWQHRDSGPASPLSQETDTTLQR